MTTDELAMVCPHCGDELRLSETGATMKCRWCGPVREATDEEREKRD